MSDVERAVQRDIVLRAMATACVLSFGCVAPRAPLTPSTQSDLGRDELVEDLRSQVEHATREREQLGLRRLAFVQESVAVLTETSAALPGVAYRWGTFQPIGTVDLVFSAVVAVSRDEAQLLRTPMDMGVLIRKHNLRLSADQAVAWCAETVTYVGPRRDVGIRPRVYKDASSVADLFDVDRDSLALRGMAPPTVTRQLSGGWHVILWAIEAGQTTKYLCGYGEGATVGLTAIDSVEGVGFQPRSP